MNLDGMETSVNEHLMLCYHSDDNHLQRAHQISVHSSTVTCSFHGPFMKSTTKGYYMNYPSVERSFQGLTTASLIFKCECEYDDLGVGS